MKKLDALAAGNLRIGGLASFVGLVRDMAEGAQIVTLGQRTLKSGQKVAATTRAAGTIANNDTASDIHTAR